MLSHGPLTPTPRALRTVKSQLPVFTSENRSDATEKRKGSDDVTGDATPSPARAGPGWAPRSVLRRRSQVTTCRAPRLASWGLLEPVFAQPPPRPSATRPQPVQACSDTPGGRGGGAGRCTQRP